MPTKRPYDQFCPIATALDAVGDRWTLLIVRELFLGPIRYAEMLRSLKPISTDVLASRLRTLETGGILVRTDNGRYELTDNGRALAPVLRALGSWGADRLRPPGHDDDLAAARALQLLAIARSETPADRYNVEIRADDLVATIITGPDGWTVSLQPADRPDAVVRLDGMTLWQLAAGDLAWPDAVASGRLEIDGDPRGPEALLAGTMPSPLANLTHGVSPSGQPARG